MHNLFLVYFVNLYMFRAYLSPSSWHTTVVQRGEIKTHCSLSLKVYNNNRSANRSLFKEPKLQRWYAANCNIDTKDYISRAVTGTKVNIVDMFNYEFPTTTVYIQQSVHIILFRLLPDCSNPTRTTVSHLKRIISTDCCMYTVVPPDDGLRYARNM